jgi:hypothetical protein
MKCLSPFKRGDSFILNCTYKVDGEPESISGKTIDSQVRDSSGRLIATMEVEPDDSDPTKFVLTPDNSTSTWPLSTLLCDIQISESGNVRSTETIQIPVVEDITK